MPKCKTCSNYWHKDWSVNFECKLGHNTPDFGDTDACPSYEEQYTFGKERGWSHEEKRSKQETNHGHKRKSGSSSYGGYSGGGGGSGDFSILGGIGEFFGRSIIGLICGGVSLGIIELLKYQKIDPDSGLFWLGMLVAVPAGIAAIYFVFPLVIVLGVLALICHLIGI